MRSAGYCRDASEVPAPAEMVGCLLGGFVAAGTFRWRAEAVPATGSAAKNEKYASERAHASVKWKPNRKANSGDAWELQKSTRLRILHAAHCAASLGAFACIGFVASGILAKSRPPGSASSGAD